MTDNRWEDAIAQERKRTERVTEIITDESHASRVLQDLWGVDMSFFAGKTVLAVGGGMGLIHAFNKTKRRVSVDPLYGEYEVQPSETGVDLVKGAGEHLPVPSDEFNIAFSNHVLEHTKDPEEVVAQIYESLAPNGSFLLEAHVSRLPHVARKALAEHDLMGAETAHPWMPNRQEVLDLLDHVGFDYEVTKHARISHKNYRFDFNKPLTSIYTKVKQQKNLALIATKPGR